MKDQYHNQDWGLLYGPASFTADATSSTMDLQGSEGADIIISVGAFSVGGNATNYVEFTLQDSDDAITWAAAAAADVLGGTGVVTVDATSEDAAIYDRGYVGDARYLRVILNEVGTVTIPVSIAAQFTHGRYNPMQ